MNSEPNQKLEIELGRNWPEQIIVDHEPYWRAWRRHARKCNDRVEEIYDTIAQILCACANGKNLNPQLMLDFMQTVAARQSLTSESGIITNQHANRYRSAVRGYLKWLYLMGAIERDPGDCLPRLKKQPLPPKEIYTHEEYLHMVKYGEELGSRSTELWLVILGYHTGMSLVDCCTLNWNEVHLVDDGPCFIRRMRAKLVTRLGTKSMCTVPILAGGELWVRLKRLQSRREMEVDRIAGVEFVHHAASLWYGENHQNASHAMCRFISGALGKDRGERTFRNLRNTFASRLINAGTDCVLVSKMTGHQTVQQLAEYVIPNQEAMQKAILNGMRFVEGDNKVASVVEETPKAEGGACS